MATERRTMDVRRLGMISYGDALALQAELVKQRRAGEIPDTLLLLEHPHAITLGSGSHDENVLVSPEERAARGIEGRPVEMAEVEASAVRWFERIFERAAVGG